jgi:hypothetical protein
MRLLVTPLAVAALAGLATGAGALTEPAYVKAASKICAHRHAQLAKLPRLSKVSTPQLAGRLRQVIAIYARGTQRLAKLREPRTLSYLVPRWLRYERRRVATLRLALRAAASGKRSLAFGKIGQANVFGLRAAEISNGLGIPLCE